MYITDVFGYQWLGRFLVIIGSDLRVCKSNWLHVDILRLSFIKLAYTLLISIKWSVIFLQSWTSTSYFSISTGSSVTNCRFSSIIVGYFKLSLYVVNIGNEEGTWHPPTAILVQLVHTSWRSCRTVRWFLFLSPCFHNDVYERDLFTPLLEKLELYVFGIPFSFYNLSLLNECPDFQ